jgi:hypothetical protein
MTDALERLIALYQVERSDGETATAFFGRVHLDRVKEVLSGFADLTPETAQPTDFVDLGEDREYRVETKEGECAT